MTDDERTRLKELLDELNDLHDEAVGLTGPIVFGSEDPVEAVRSAHRIEDILNNVGRRLNTLTDVVFHLAGAHGVRATDATDADEPPST